MRTSIRSSSRAASVGTAVVAAGALVAFPSPDVDGRNEQPTAAEIRENYAGLFVWDRVATGLILATPEVSTETVASPVIAPDAEGKILTASVPDDRLEDFFGIELPGVTGMTVAVAYTASAIRSFTLAYTQNDASVTVTVTYTY